MKSIVAILGVLLAVHVSLQAQTHISGLILNKAGEPFFGANITISHRESNIIIAFAFSEQNGYYRIEVISAADSLILSVSAMGYKAQNRVIANRSQKVDFALAIEPFQLQEVIVRAPVIERAGDTIIYSVPAFMRSQDRVIGDVLRRLPGIDVLSDGRVLYQGRPIQKYLIEGLDLLGGRYNLVNNNLPAEAVSQVEIIENHQPIRILDSLVFSDRASLNIRLKSNVAWTGTSQLGSGIEPTLWDVSATPMMFNRNHQMLISYQTNNVGDDVARELNRLTIEDLLDKLHSRTEKRSWVQIQTLPTPRPGLSARTFLNNNSHLGSANYLIRLKRDFELRINTSYLHHLHKQRGESFSQLFTPLDTITFFQNVNNEQLDHHLSNTLTLTRNTPRNYFVNELEFNTQWDRGSGFVEENTTGIQQNLKSPFTSFSNRLTSLLPLGDQIVSVRSFLTYTHTSQSLLISPPPFANMANLGNSIEALQQDVDGSSFFINNLISFTRKIKGISFTPTVGFLVHNRELRSNLWKLNDGITESPGSEYGNTLEFLNRSAYASLKSQYRYNTWRIEASGRFVYNHFGIQKQGVQNNSPGGKLDFEPSFSVHKDLNSQWKLSSGISKQKFYGSIEHLYEGYILTHYRLLQRNIPAFLEQSIQSFGVRGEYRNTLRARFFNWAYAYSRINSNLVYSHKLSPEGYTIMQAIEMPTIQQTHHLNFRLSQHLRPLNTDIAFTPSYTLMNQEFLLNDELVDVKIHNFHLSARLEKGIFTWWEALYTPSLRMGITDLKSSQSQRRHTWSHLLELNFNPAEHHNFNIEALYYQSTIQDDRNNSFLLNFAYNLKLPLRRLEMYLAWNNVLNTKNFHTVISSQYSIVSRTFMLRPSELLFGLRFSF